MDGWRNGWMDGCMDGWMDDHVLPLLYFLLPPLLYWVLCLMVFCQGFVKLIAFSGVTHQAYCKGGDGL
jgi:hypothetical protein